MFKAQIHGLRSIAAIRNINELLRNEGNEKSLRMVELLILNL